MKRRSFSKVLSGLMVLALSAALCGCGGGKTAETSASDNTSSEQTTEASNDQTEAAATEGAATEGAATEDGGCLVFGMTQEVSSVDPHMDTDAATRSVLFNIFEGLVKPTSTGDLIPAVASEYIISEDAKTYTFTLRDGIKFHNGDAVTVEDIKYSLERSAEIDGEASALSVISEINLPDEKTVEIVLAEPNSEFIYNLTIAVLQEANDANQATAPVGTGPFALTEFKIGQYILMDKFADYWNQEIDYIDQAKVKFIKDADAAFLELQGGSIDGIQYLTYDQVSTLGDDFEVIQGTMMLVHGMFLNNSVEPLSNVTVRQAINYAIDRDEINAQLFNGQSMITNTHGYPLITAWYNPDTEGTYTYDPEKAKALLAEAGYENGFDLVITVPSSYTQHMNTAQIIVEELSAVGINATINGVEWADWLSGTYQGRDYQATIIGFDISSLSPATWYKRYYSTSSNCMTNFNNADYDALYEQAIATVDFDEKFELYSQMQAILADQAASVFIEDPADFVALSKKFTGYKFYPVSAIDFSQVQYAK